MSTRQKKRFKRKKLLINKPFQTKFIINIYIIIIILVFLLGMLFVHLSTHQMIGSVYSKIATMKSTKQVLLPLVLKISFIILLLAFIIVGLRFLLFSHKIVGPMLRFERSLNELKQGNLTVRVKLRKHDEFQGMANSLTLAVAELNKRMKKIRKNSNSIGNILKKKKMSSLNISKINEYHQEIEKIFKSFKI